MKHTAGRTTGQHVAALVAGALFGVGLTVSGMTQPQKIISFLDVAGDWDPSLLFVMMGAVAVHFVAYRLIRRREAPLFAGEFVVPSRRDLDLKLLGGAALFGVGWGLGGYCPGPGLVSLSWGGPGALVFVLFMVGGMFLATKLESRAR